MTSSPHTHAHRPPHALRPATPQVSALQRAHTLLRGRYHWAILLAVLLGAAGGYVGYRSVELEYRANGAVRVNSYVPKLLYSTEETGIMQGFDTFLVAQEELLGSHRVTDMAMSSDAWRNLGREFTPETQAAFRSALQVRRGKDSDIITVSFTDPDRNAAEKAVNGVIESYQRVFSEMDRQQETRRLTLLDERRAGLARELDSLRNQIRSFGDAFGPDGVKYRHTALASHLQSIEEAIREAQLELASAKKRLEAGPQGILEGGLDDPRIAHLRAQLNGRETELAVLQQRFPLNHPSTRRVVDEIGALKQMIEAETAALPAGEAADASDASDTAWQAEHQREVDLLEARAADLEALFTQAKTQFGAISAEKHRLETLETQAKDVERKLDEVAFRIETLNVESAAGGRVVVMDTGKAGHEPVNVRQPLQYAALGGLGGAAAGVGLVMLVSLVNPRVRYSGDLPLTSDVKILGMLPHLPNRIEGPEDATLVGHSVHQLRMLLQLEGGGQDVRSFMISGPSAGAGKTSVTLALGLSFAAAGARTLMVDFDLVGGGLTRRLNVTRRKRLGRLLQDQSLVSAELVERAASSDSADMRLGEKLLAISAVTPEDLERALRLQPESAAGLLDVLGGEPLEACVTALPVPDLSVLSLGNATADHISRVGRAAVARFIAEARSRYDVVLIDTGPAPGSVETALVAAESDRVVLVTSRGDQVRQLNECLRFLRSVGATVAGIIYNRAEQRDIERSPYSSAKSARSSASAGGAASASHYGPLASLATGAPTGSDGRGRVGIN